MRPFGTLLFIILSVLCLHIQCDDNNNKKRAAVSIGYLDSVRIKSLVVQNRTIRRTIDQLRLRTRDTTFIDLCVNRYYAEKRPYLWITRNGIDHRADTLLRRIEKIPETGIDAEILFIPLLQKELHRLRTLDFTDQNRINQTLARLEYYLTKAFLRYASGQRFGFINPRILFNRIELEDTLKNQFKVLFDIPVSSAGQAFVDTAFTALRQDRLPSFLNDIQPDDTLYTRYMEAYAASGTNKQQRKSLIAAMERCRWRTIPRQEGKRIIVNLPAWNLEASDYHTGARIEMRICAGSSKNKTPLLTSRIKRMELNPYWIVPQSIVRKEIATQHVQDADYFTRNYMEIIDKESKEVLEPEKVTAEMLLSGDYTVRQEKGENNSLGRIIFRFPNNFAIYLHDTPNRSAFNQTWRGVSHGCIRLEQPLLLADFLYEEEDSERFMERVRLSIEQPPQTDYGKKLQDNPKFQPLTSHTFQSETPVYIDYRTVWPDHTGKLCYYPDTYRYDELIIKQLTTYKLR